MRRSVDSSCFALVTTCMTPASAPASFYSDRVDDTADERTTEWHTTSVPYLECMAWPPEDAFAPGTSSESQIGERPTLLRNREVIHGIVKQTASSTSQQLERWQARRAAAGSSHMCLGCIPGKPDECVSGNVCERERGDLGGGRLGMTWHRQRRMSGTLGEEWWAMGSTLVISVGRVCH